jgi:hypothetical protein
LNDEGLILFPFAICSTLWNLLPEDWATTRKKNKIAETEFTMNDAEYKTVFYLSILNAC